MILLVKDPKTLDMDNNHIKLIKLLEEPNLTRFWPQVGNKTISEAMLEEKLCRCLKE